jgi:hypothetical protein
MADDGETDDLDLYVGNIDGHEDTVDDEVIEAVAAGAAGEATIVNTLNERSEWIRRAFDRDEWEGGEPIIAAWAEAYGGFENVNFANVLEWAKGYAMNMLYASYDDEVNELMATPIQVREVSPEQAKKTEEEILAFEARSPGYHLERFDYDPKNPRKGTVQMSKPPVKAKPKRKSRKKPLFWTRPKD